MGKVVTKSDWKVIDMPKKTISFLINNDLAETEIEKLKEGYIPQEMEDKWFTYFENNKLYLHRSWTGICIYIVEFLDKELKITLNVDKVHKKKKYIQESKKFIGMILHGLAKMK